MPIRAFEVLCVAIIALTLVFMSRRRRPRDLLGDYAALAIAGWIGEVTCIRFYGMYSYGASWDLFLGPVPALVPLIWPLVLLSARDVAISLFPRSSRGARALIVLTLVTFDASLVEVIAVHAGLWSWTEPGLLGVPLIGILGWGLFASSAELTLSSGLPAPRLITVALAPATMHLLLIACWWGCLRWVGREDLGPASAAAVALIGLAALLIALGRRRLGHVIPMPVALPRMIAASLFLCLLVLSRAVEAPLWIHALAVGAPYMAATQWAASRSAAAPA